MFVSYYFGYVTSRKRWQKKIECASVIHYNTLRFDVIKHTKLLQNRYNNALGTFHKTTDQMANRRRNVEYVNNFNKINFCVCQWHFM